MPKRKRSLSHALDIKDRGKIFFPSTTVSGDWDETLGDTPLAPEPADGILGPLAEASKCKKSYQSQLSQISTCGAWSRQEGNISVKSSFPNSDRRVKQLYELDL